MSLNSNQTRAFSSASNLFSTSNDSYDTLDLNKLYEDVLRIAILEYRTEARFRTPFFKRPLSTINSSNSSPMTKNKSSDKLSEKTFAKFRSHSTNKIDLPSHTLTSLETRLNYIAMNQTKLKMDKNTVRSLLRMYSELLDPATKKEYARIKQPEALVVKFISCANKELTKVTTDSVDVSNSVFQQTNAFVDILINIIKSDKNSSDIIARLEEYKESLKPTKKSNSNSLTPSNSMTQEVKYTAPSFRVSEMEAARFVAKLFNIDEVKLQQDVFKLKDVSTEETLIKDMLQVKTYLGKELGNFTKEDFLEREYYIYWKQRELEGCDQVIKRYQPPSNMKVAEPPKLKAGESYYFIPQNARAGMVVLNKLCLSHDLGTELLLSKASLDIINSCSRIWRIDYPSKAVALYTAANLSILSDLEIDKIAVVFQICKRIVTEQGKMHWSQRLMWSNIDNDEWVHNLSNSYSQVLSSMRESLGSIFSQTKPRFKSYLEILGDHIEADAAFQLIEASGLPKKWEKKLYKALLRVSEVRYAELLKNLPRDNTLNVVHILNISDSITGDIKLLQKRYTSPLLGFLNIPRTAAAVITAMFSADSGNILKHIHSYAKRQNSSIEFGDAIEAYKSLYEIRSIHEQVAMKGSVFQFDLESFFYPFIEEWANESGEKIMGIVNQAISQDSFESLDIENEDSKHSVSVVDIFKMINELFKILRDLDWQNEFQLSKLYTILLKNVSDGIVNYSNKVTDRIIKDLAENLDEGEGSADNRKSGSGSKWFDGVRAAVTGGSKLEKEDPYAFQPETCVALNNLSAMLRNLDAIEELIDPESISKTVEKYEPKMKNSFTSHLFSVRIVKAENLKPAANGSIHPYITLIDAKAKRRIGKTRTIDNSTNPEWDEEFEMTLPGNSSLTISATVWDEKFGTHSICGRAILQLDPRRFNNDGIAEDIYLDLDPQGRVLVEVAMESERVDAIFCLGRAHRCLKRCQERAIKLIVEKFSRFVHMAFSRSTLKSICGANGLLKPQKDMVDEAIAPLYDYLNSNLEVLAEYLTKELLLKVMLAAWYVAVLSADTLILPKLASAKTFNLSNIGSKSIPQGGNGWQSAVSSAVANVKGSIGIAGYGRPLTSQELDTVFSWLNYLCFDFFHHDGNGPPLRDLKNENYQALLLVPVYYDRDTLFLQQEVERLSPAFVRSLRDKHNFEDNSKFKEKANNIEPDLSRAGTLVRNKTIMANGTAKARAKAAKEAQEARSDPIAAQAAAEDIILRLLLIKDDRSYVAKRLEQREKMAHSIATERLARAAVEGRF